MLRLQGHCRLRGVGELVPGSRPADRHAGGAPAAREPAVQVEIRAAQSDLPQRGRRLRLIDRPARGKERYEQLQGQAQEARRPWAQPARLAARVKAKREQKCQSPSPADKRDHPCRPLRPPPAARVQKKEGLAPEARLPWAQPYGQVQDLPRRAVSRGGGPSVPTLRRHSGARGSSVPLNDDCARGSVSPHLTTAGTTVSGVKGVVSPT